MSQKKSKKGFYILSIAASICLVCVAAWLFVQPNENNGDEFTAKTEKELATDKTNTETAAAKKDEKPEESVEKSPVQQIAPSSPQVLVAQEDATEQNAAPLKEIQEHIEPTFENSRRVFVAALEPAELQTNSLRKPSLKFSILMNDKVSQFVTASVKYTDDEALMGKKKFSFMSGIVSVAKGVNEGTKALSEMRKSKIEFVNSELKYGSDQDQSPEEFQQRQVSYM